MSPAAGAAPRRVVLCADDFGMEPSVNEGILRLAAAGRITAVTCMVDMPAWREGSRALPGVSARADAGLHLDLGTRSAAELLALAARGALGLVDGDRIAERVAAQLDRFEAATGAPPAFVDGHHHVHQLRPVRTALLRVLRARYGDRAPYVRNVVPLRPRGMKAAGNGTGAAIGQRGKRMLPRAATTGVRRRGGQFFPAGSSPAACFRRCRWR